MMELTELFNTDLQKHSFEKDSGECRACGFHRDEIDISNSECCPDRLKHSNALNPFGEFDQTKRSGKY